MTIASALEMALAAMVLGVAVWTIAARETFAAVEGFVAYGLLLAARLGASRRRRRGADRGCDRRRLERRPAAGRGGAPAGYRDAGGGGTPGGILRLAAAVLSATVAAALAAGVLFLPDPAPTLAPAAAANAAATGLGNPVTNVLMAFRAMDTMLEKVVLLLALVGVWSLAPDRLWGGHPGPRHQADPRGVLAFLARLLPPVGIVVGIYIFWVGADHPGGAFQGGTILAAMWLLVMMAGLTDAPPIGRRWLRLMLIAGPVIFLVVGLGGLWLGDAFLAYPLAYAKPLILAIEVAMTLTIAVTLACCWPVRRNGALSDERGDRIRAVRCDGGGARAVRSDRESPAASQDPRLQSARQRRVPVLRRRRAPGCGGGVRRRSGPAGARHHGNRRRLFRDGPGGCAVAAAVPGHRLGHAAR